MEAMDILEQKISKLLEMIKALKEENSILVKENKALAKKADDLESSIFSGQQELDVERERAKIFVDGLLKSIDLLVESEQP